MQSISLQTISYNLYVKQVVIFFTSEALKDISTLNVDNDKNIKNLIDINVEPKCENLLATLSIECALEIRSICLNFYKTAFKELLKRLALRQPV